MLPLREEVVHDVPNLDPKDPCIITDQLELKNNNQQEFGTEDHGDELNMVKEVPDPIDVEPEITVDAVADVKVEVTTNMVLEPILNESAEEPIHFLAIAEKVLAEKINEFDSFSSNKSNKGRMTKISQDMEGRELEAIIPWKIIWGFLKFGTK
ncbi:hypothetical protein J1N35_007882 [Gossypium stocksii]|uniref:Uncharacterized protein n=1 Tax=Gossypium stocksii TaxID=47602 RepID=A0A9D3W6V6_9ROSI|nr:hypothetical protein J1N35_007882 [Gossypium stocksii]